jgi:hypothetical protein
MLHGKMGAHLMLVRYGFFSTLLGIGERWQKGTVQVDTR